MVGQVGLNYKGEANGVILESISFTNKKREPHFQIRYSTLRRGKGKGVHFLYIQKPKRILNQKGETATSPHFITKVQTRTETYYFIKVHAQFKRRGTKGRESFPFVPTNHIELIQYYSNDLRLRKPNLYSYWEWMREMRDLGLVKLEWFVFWMGNLI